MRYQKKKSYNNEFKNKINDSSKVPFIGFMEQLLYKNKYLYFLINHSLLTRIINSFLFISFIFFILHNLGYDELYLFRFLPLSLKQIILKSIHFIFFCFIFLCATYLVSFNFLQYSSLYFYAYYIIWLLNYLYEIKNVLIILVFSIQVLYLKIQVIIFGLNMMIFWLIWFMLVEVWPTIQEIWDAFMQ